MSTNSSSAGIRLNACVYAISSVASLIQAVVFFKLSAKKHLLLFAQFVTTFLLNLLYSIALFGMSMDTTYLSGARNVDQKWILYVYQLSMALASSSNFILTHLCLHLWITLQFKNDQYLKNARLAQLLYTLVSFSVAIAEFAAFLAFCNDTCNQGNPVWANYVSVFYVVIVGGVFLAAFVSLIAKQRRECFKILQRCSISPSLVYRFIFAFVFLILLGIFAILSALKDLQSASFNFPILDLPYTSSFRLGSVAALAQVVVLGSSSECLDLWRSWIKKYIGIDLTVTKSTRNSTVQSNGKV